MDDTHCSLVSRRHLITALGAAIVGFDATAGTWVTAADAAAGSRIDDCLPRLDGTLHLDEATRTEYAQDFGQIVHEQPLAVLKPGSVNDIRAVLAFCCANGIRVVSRGRGHTTFGQAQLRAGVVVDISTLNRVHRLTNRHVEVDAGLRWNALLERTSKHGLMPPTLTDYIGQTVGGTLSVGGIGGAVFRHGAQVDNVLELQVVTGRGELITCSAHRHRKLFEAALAGQGQVGIIVRASLALVPAPQRIRVYNLIYPDLPTLTAEVQRLMDDGRFDFLEAFAFPQPSGAWIHLLQAGSHYTSPSVPDDTRLLAGLHDIRSAMSVEDTTFETFANRVQIGASAQAHPWIDLILPYPAIDGFMAQVEQTLKALLPDDSFQLLLIPMRTDRFKRPLFRAPTARHAFGFGILRFMPYERAAVEKALHYNRWLFDQCRDLGGTHYPISAVRLERDDWLHHYGAQFTALAAAKARHDPGNVFGSGPDIF